MTPTRAHDTITTTRAHDNKYSKCTHEHARKWVETISWKVKRNLDFVEGALERCTLLAAAIVSCFHFKFLLDSVVTQTAI